MELEPNASPITEGLTMKRRAICVLAVTVIWLFSGQPGWAQKYESKESPELAKAVQGAKASLERGLLASRREGTPISGKFEIEEGKFQLSIYTQKGDKFSEVIVDHQTGKIAKVEPITGGEDLTAAKAESEAIAKAKRSLQAVVEKALKAHKGSRAASVTPTLKDGRPVAEVTLVKGKEFKTVTEKLD
jgi:uncharacterized membrane protein YkoI